MYQVGMLRRISIFIVVLISINISCNTNDRMDGRTINSAKVGGSTYQPMITLDTCNTTYSVYTKLMNETFNEEIESNEVINGLHKSKWEKSLILRMIRLVEKMKNESSSENFGTVVFESLKSNHVNQSLLLSVLNCLPSEDASKATKRLIQIMDIDLISNEYTRSMFIKDFSLFYNSIGIATFNTIKQNADVGEN